MGFSTFGTVNGGPVLAVGRPNTDSNGNIILPKTSGVGIKVDEDIPVFGWKDLTGQIIPRVGGGAAPAFTAWRGGNQRNYAFNTNEMIDLITFHMPHDWVPGTHLYLHTHWGHNGTAISGNFSFEYYVTWSKGYTQGIGTAEITIPDTIATPDVATFPRWAHNIKEVQLSNVGGDATHLDTGALEVDGLIEIAFKVTTIPTITGSAASNLPYVKMIDLHYQSTQTATKNRNIPFYT